jgi:hypothetical protein
MKPIAGEDVWVSIIGRRPQPIAVGRRVEIVGS